MRRLNDLVSVVGRRESLRYIGCGVIAATGTALLGACGGADSQGSGKGRTTDNSGGSPNATSSVASQTLLAFAKGTWHVTFPMNEDRESITLKVDSGTWSASSSGRTDSSQGTWKYASGTLQVLDWEGQGNAGTAAEVPGIVNRDAIPEAVSWAWKPTYTETDQMTPQLKWDKSTETMTIIGTSADGEPLVIKAKRA